MLRNPFHSITDQPGGTAEDIKQGKKPVHMQLGTLSKAFKGLDECQQSYVRGIMMKSWGLNIQGIKEQRQSADWKWVECVCCALTPIFISIMGNFGEGFREPIQILAIILSLVSTFSRLTPQGRGEAMLCYSEDLVALCWNYWAVRGEFRDAFDELSAERSAKAQSHWFD